MNKERETRKEVEKRLQKIIVYLRGRGLITADDLDYKSFLGKVGVIASAFGLALSLKQEDELCEIMSSFSNKLILMLDDDPEDIDMDAILGMLGNQNPDLN